METETKPSTDQWSAGDTVLDEWMTLDELAAALGVHKKTFRTWNRQRHGPPFARVGLRQQEENP